VGDVQGQLAELRRIVRDLGRVVVAFSGGVDSGLLAWVAGDELGADRSLAVTAVSPSLLPSERDDCGRLARGWGLRWIPVGTDEGSRPGYVANGPDRCYHCKSALMDALAPIARSESAAVILAVNLDDLDDHRPGQAAARERGASFPLVEAGFTKADVRSAAKFLGLETWDKPAAACLASRIPYGTEVTIGTLSRVAEAEEALRSLGYRQLRVRHYGDLARIEFGADELERSWPDRERVVAAVKSAGYRYITVDLEGLRSGNLNEALGRNVSSG
jgi:uncharacterized protein